MEPVFHYLIPVLLLIFFFPELKKRVGLKWVFALGFIAILPDFDCFVFGNHRFLFHNVFFALIVLLLAYFLLGKIIGLISLYFIGSHLLFDLAKPGVALFYPLSNLLFYLEIIISSSYKWLLKIDFGILGPDAIDPYWPHRFLQQWGALVLILVLVLFVIYFIKNNIKNNKRKTFKLIPSKT